VRATPSLPRAKAVLNKARADFWWGVALIVLAALSWSTAGLFPRLVSTDVFTTLFWRSLLGGLTVLALQAALNKRHDLPSLWKLSRPELGMSVLTAVAMISFIAAFFYASVADVVFIYGAFPILTLVLSALLLHTGIRGLDVACALVVALGVTLILWGQASLQNAFGALLSFAATVMFALMTVGIKRYPNAEMVKVTYTGAFLSALMMLPFTDFAHTSQRDIAWLWLYGVLNIGVGFGLFLLGVRRIKTVLASLICMIEIPLAPLWAYALFGEQVSMQSLAGGAVILLAVLANLAWSS
jgi:drug/metabolite transporter (DMT)-like permease